MNLKNYLRRIGLDVAEMRVDRKTLGLLQKSHLLRVPFENLDIHWNRPIALDTADFYDKIVTDKRGGFCYELNGLFNELLKEIGFVTRIISARVSQRDGGFGAEYDHLAIVAQIGTDEFLVDVGFGDFIAEPLKFVLDIGQKDANGTFLIRKFDGEYLEVVKKGRGDWESEYIFKPAGRELPEFAGMCRFHQTSPESHFTRGRVCSIMLENGRKTLSDKMFIETVDGERKETSVDSEADFCRILEGEFGIKQNPRGFG